MKLPKLFSRSPATETKESRAAATLVVNPGQPVWSKRDFAAFAKEGYAQNVVAAMCVQKIAEAVSSVKLEVWRGETELTEHPLLALFDRPNPLQGGREYIEAYISYLMISGNAYEERFDIGSEPRELYVLRPDRMLPIIGIDGLPSGYEYRGPNGQRRRWDVDVISGSYPIWHTRLFNPLDDWLGQSPMEAGAYSIDQHNESMGWMQALLQNSAKPSGALVVDKDKTLGDEEYHRLKTQIEDQYSGARNAGRPMLLEGGLDWKQMGFSPTDMGIMDAKNSAARDVCLAFGVPPQLMGIPGDNTYSNYQEARLSFWEDTVIPLLGRMVDERNRWLAEPMGVEIRANLDEVPAIVDKRRSLWDMADKSTDLTINERRELKGYEPIPGGDVLPQDRTMTADQSTQDTNIKALAKIAGYETASRK